MASIPTTAVTSSIRTTAGATSFSPSAFSAFARSLFQILTDFSTAPLAYLLSRYDLPGKAAFLRLLLPFVTPTLVAVLGLSALAGPHGWLTRATGLDLSDTPALLIWGNLFFNLPVMLRLAYGAFSRVPPGLIVGTASAPKIIAPILARASVRENHQAPSSEMVRPPMPNPITPVSCSCRVRGPSST